MSTLILAHKTTASHAHASPRGHASLADRNLSRFLDCAQSRQPTKSHRLPRPPNSASCERPMQQWSPSPFLDGGSSFMTVNRVKLHARTIAFCLMFDGSHTKVSCVSQMPSLTMSTPKYLPPDACFCRSLLRMSVESNPAF